MEEEKKLWTTIYLEPDEEINNIINKVRECQGEKIALVLHQQSKVLHQETNFKLLKYYLDREKKQGSIVCSEPAVEQLGKKVGMMVVSTLQELAVSSEKSIPAIVPKETRRGPIYLVWNRRRVLTVFSFLLGLAFLGIIYSNLPWTTLEVVPAAKTLEKDLTLRISSQYKEINLEQRILPAAEKQEEIVLHNDFAATGIKVVGKTKARGEVMIINEGPQPAFLSAGTTVSTLGGGEFTTTKNISIPKRQVEMFMGVPVGLRAGKMQVEVVAKNPGTSGNVGSGEISRIAGDKLRVVNANPTTGGEDQQIKFLTPEDLARAKAAMKTRLIQTVSAKLKGEIGQENILLDNSLCIKNLEIGYNKKVGEQTENFTAEAKVKASVLLLSKASLQKTSNYWLKKTVDPNYRLRSSEAHIVSWQGALVSPKLYNLQVHINGSLRAKLNAEKIKEQIKGLSSEAAEARLTKLSEIGYFHLKTKGKVPQNAFLIKIKVKDPLVNE